MAMFFLGLIPLWIFHFDYSSKLVIALCLGGLLMGLLINLINKFAIPTKWAFKNRFGINGVIVLVFYIMLISPFWNGHAISFQALLIGSILGFFTIGFFFKSNYMTAMSKKSFDKSLLDDEIISDFCSTKENGKTIVGVLILRNKKRLIFMPVDFEYHFLILIYWSRKMLNFKKKLGYQMELLSMKT